MDGAAANSSGEKTVKIPVVRDPRYHRYSPLAVGVSRMPAEMVDKFELRLQSPVQRDVSHRFGAMANGEVGIVEREVSLEIIEHAAIELTPRQLIRLRDDISRQLGAAPGSEEVARDRLTELAGLIAAAETAVAQAGARSRESGVVAPEKAELAMLNARVELLASAMARVEGLAAQWSSRAGPRPEQNGGERGVQAASSRAALFDPARQERRPPPPPVGPPPAPPKGNGGLLAMLLLLLVVCGVGALAWANNPPLRAAVTDWFSATFSGVAPWATSSTTADGADRAATAAPVPPPQAPGTSSAPDTTRLAGTDPMPAAKLAPAAAAPTAAPAPQQFAGAPSGRDIEAPVAEPPAANAPVEPKVPPPAAKEAAAAAPLVHQTILARADAWVRVRDARGTTYIERILKAGETWPVPVVPGLTLTTGNAGGTFLVVDGVVGPALGAAGATRAGVQLSPPAP